MKNLNDSFILSNKNKIPCIGYGTWQLPDNESTVECIVQAIKDGYRHIDTASLYGNEKNVGKAIKKSNIEREEIFITSKVWNTERGYDSTIRAFNKTLENLQLDYLDLYLIHWPASVHQFKDWDKLNLETWKALTNLYKKRKIKAIGVSNFLPHHLDSLMKTEIKPMVNQIEFHPGYMQKETIKYCRDNSILVEAWSPLGYGRILKDERLIKIAEKYNRSTAQICIRWCLQHKVIPLPKTVTLSRIRENANVFDFEISKEDMNYIDSFEEIGFSGSHPDKVNF